MDFGGTKSPTVGDNRSGYALDCKSGRGKHKACAERFVFSPEWNLVMVAEADVHSWRLPTKRFAQYESRLFFRFSVPLVM